MIDARLLALQDTIDALMFQIAEMQRRMSLTVVPGTIKSGDPKKGYVVDIGFETHDIPDGAHAGHGADHAPLKKGQQVTLLCPGGDLANAFVMAGGYHEDNPRISDSDDEDIRAARGDKGKKKQLRTTDDGAFLENHEKKTFVRAGKEAAELVHEQGQSAVRAKDSGAVHLEVVNIEKLKIVIGNQAFYINPTALLPTSV